MQDFELTDAIYRSRKTVLDMLEARDYITTPYRNYSPKEITFMMASLNGTALRMDLSHKNGSKKCIIVYSLTKLKQKLKTFLANMSDADKPEYIEDIPNTEVIILVAEPVVETFHQTVLANYIDTKLRAFVFQIQTIVNDPSKHIVVPKHAKVPAEEHAELLEKLYLKSKSQLQLIRFHADIQARYLGLVPGDIVKIVRPSPSAGEYTLYRVCTP